MLAVSKLRNWRTLILIALSFLLLQWYLRISDVFPHPPPPLLSNGLANVELARAGGQTSEINHEAKNPSVNTLSPIPRLPPLTKNTVVVARLKTEDVDWVSKELPEWSSAIYTVDDPNAVLRPPKNKGNEAMVYLSYLIDYYDELPPVSVFVHAHRDGFPRAWHTDADNYSNVKSIRGLRLETVLARGYVNLRCNWVPGCPDEIQPFRAKGAYRDESDFMTAWKEIFGNSSTSSDVPEVVGVACCAQFAVSKQQILARSKSEYETYRNWLLNTPLDSSTSGWVFEYLWHIIFGAPAVFCPTYYTCSCDVYGRC